MFKTDKETFKNLLIIVTGMLALSYIFGLEKFNYSWAHYLVPVATVIALVGLIIPPFAALVVNGWMKLGHALGYVNSRILLSVIFYLILFPVSIMARLGRKDLLGIKQSSESSHFEDRSHKYTAKDLENPW